MTGVILGIVLAGLAFIAKWDRRLPMDGRAWAWTVVCALLEGAALREAATQCPGAGARCHRRLSAPGLCDGCPDLPGVQFYLVACSGGRSSFPGERPGRSNCVPGSFLGAAAGPVWENVRQGGLLCILCLWSGGSCPGYGNGRISGPYASGLDVFGPGAGGRREHRQEGQAEKAGPLPALYHCGFLGVRLSGRHLGKTLFFWVNRRVPG